MRHPLTQLCLMTLQTLFVAQDRPRIVSPEVRKDRSVVFRLWAPQASDVQLTGNWMGSTPPLALSKGADGVCDGNGRTDGTEHLFIRIPC